MKENTNRELEEALSREFTDGEAIDISNFIPQKVIEYAKQVIELSQKITEEMLICSNILKDDPETLVSLGSEDIRYDVFKYLLVNDALMELVDKAIALDGSISITKESVDKILSDTGVSFSDATMRLMMHSLLRRFTE